MLGTLPSGTFFPTPPRHSGEPIMAIRLPSGENFALATKPSSLTRHSAFSVSRSMLQMEKSVVGRAVSLRLVVMNSTRLLSGLMSSSDTLRKPNVKGCTTPVCMSRSESDVRSRHPGWRSSGSTTWNTSLSSTGPLLTCERMTALPSGVISQPSPLGRLATTVSLPSAMDVLTSWRLPLSATRSPSRSSVPG